ncbi:MAG: SPOR domain-containing protein [Caulobacteraceae bacterium]
MSDYDRGPYTPGERPLTFESRHARAPARARGPAPVMLVMSLLVLTALVGAGGFWLYRNGVRGPDDAPRPVGAPVSDVRTLAPPQPQEADPGAGLSVYRDDAASPPAPPTFAPPPEAPAPRVAAPPASVDAAKLPTPPAHPPSSPSAVASSAPPKALVAKIEPATPVAPQPAAPKAGAPTGPAMVQIGAFSSAALAEKGWEAAAAAAPGAMAGKGKKVDSLDRDGSTLYRAAITGFSSREEAQALCDTLQAAGRACFVR